MIIISRKEAREQRLKRYFINKPCKKGHIAERYVSSNECCECNKLKLKNLRETDHSRYLSYKDKEYFLHKDKILSRNKIWRYHNRNKIKLRYEKYFNENRSLYLYHANKYYTTKLQRIPKWADLDKIKNIYSLREKVSKETGVIHAVDHIIPLQGKLVCGLHVENNLRIITAHENRVKHNKFNIEI